MFSCAFAALSKSLPAAHLLLVGDGPLRGDLQDLAQSLDIGDHVHFTGYQPDTAPYVQAMNVFVLSSRSEGTPQSILEACVAQIPVIASRVGGIPEIIRHNETGLLFESADDATLTTLLSELLSDPDRAQSLAANAKMFVEARFDIRRMAREYHEQFLRLLATADGARQNTHGMLPPHTNPSHSIGVH